MISLPNTWTTETESTNYYALKQKYNEEKFHLLQVHDKVFYISSPANKPSDSLALKTTIHITISTISLVQFSFQTWNSFFIFCYPLSAILIFLFKNHKSLISLCMNKLPASFHQPNPDHSFSHTSQPNCLSSSVPSSPLSLSITPTLFHYKLKRYLFLKSFPP